MTKELTRPEITDSSYLECHVPLGKKNCMTFCSQRKESQRVNVYTKYCGEVTGRPATANLEICTVLDVVCIIF